MLLKAEREREGERERRRERERTHEYAIPEAYGMGFSICIRRKNIAPYLGYNVIKFNARSYRHK